MKLIKCFFIIILLSFFYNLFLVTLGLDKSYVYHIFIIIGLIVLLSKTKSLSRISIVFIFLNLIPFLLSCVKLGFLEGFSYFLTTGLLPVIFYEAIRKNFSQDVFDIIIFYALFKYSLYIIMIPLEVYLNSRANIAGLQFSGGQYNSIAILIMILIILYVGKSIGLKIKKHFITYAKFLFFTTVLLSFSKGGLVVGLIMFLTEIRNINIKKLFVGILLVSSAYFILLNTITIENSFTLKYWLLRFDLYDNITGNVNISSSSLTEALQSNSRDIFYSFLNERNFLDFLVGSGIGTSTYIIKEASSGEFSFGSFHNLFLTIFMERGFFFLSFFTTLLIYNISKMLIIIKEHRFRLFFYSLALLLFAISTGFEFFVNSRDFNIDFIILFFTFIYLINYYHINKNDLKYN
tara:strand:+ start:985 stop:2202 length:1218 start_codon:yes stop_codon:yes gene_type:complete